MTALAVPYSEVKIAVRELQDSSDHKKKKNARQNRRFFLIFHLFYKQEKHDMGGSTNPVEIF